MRDLSMRAWADAASFLGLVAVGTAVLYARALHSLAMPILYTEDGVWMAALFHKGFWHTLIHAKGETTPYFVSLNILLLQAAKSLNRLCCGDSLAHLPHCVSALSMLFYSFLAAAPVRLLRPFLGRIARALLWSLVIFMPVGDSAFEIFGRLSNIGFGMLFLCFCLLAWRRVADRSRPWWIVAADAGVFVCATTNPLCYPLVAVDYAIRGLALRRRGSAPLAVLRGSPAAASAAALAGGLAVAVVGMALLESRPNPFLKESFRWGEAIEAFVARSLLFPFVFPFYSALGDVATVAIAALVAGLAWWLTAGAPRERLVVLAAGAVGACAAGATLVMRPGLTRLLDGYSTSLLDRYYFGTSLFAVLAVCAAVSAGLRAPNRQRRMTAAAVVALLVAVYLVGAGSLVEVGGPRWRDLPTRDFAAAVTAAGTEVAGAKRVAVQLHPLSWQARFPVANVRATRIAVGADLLRR